MNVLIKNLLIFFIGLSVTISYVLVGCTNNSENLNKSAITILNDSVNFHKISFQNEYQKLKANQDSTADRLNSNINDLVNYINDINVNLQKLDPTDAVKIRTIFIDNHLGDSLYNKLNNVITQAKEYSTSDSLKQFIITDGNLLLGDHDINSWKALIFGGNNPIAVILFLKGIQSEIYKIGGRIFDEINK
ncbi:MAG: hypothetical protein JWQ09_5971 [Segetibacter sp.]|nr:hypothetical protein [Segetibacter sp.]